MAKPDTDDGWFKKSVELEMAVNYAGFTPLARVILGYVFLQIFGYGERPVIAKLSQKSIRERSGECRNVVCRSVKELVGSGVLVDLGGDQYRFVKDYEKWTTFDRDGKRPKLPRLNETQIRDCKLSPAYSADFRIKKSHEKTTQDTETVTQTGDIGVTQMGDAESDSVTQLGDNGKIGVTQTGYNCNPIGLQASPNWVTTHIDEAPARSEELEKERSNTAIQKERAAFASRPEEPFISPEEPMKPKAIRDMTKGDHVAAWAVSKFRERWHNDESMEEIITLDVAGWIDNQKYTEESVKKALIKSVKAASAAGGFLAYAKKIVVSDFQKEIRSDTKPSETRKIEFSNGEPKAAVLPPHIPAPQPRRVKP